MSSSSLGRLRSNIRRLAQGLITQIREGRFPQERVDGLEGFLETALGRPRLLLVVMRDGQLKAIYDGRQVDFFCYEEATDVVALPYLVLVEGGELEPAHEEGGLVHHQG